MDPRTTKNILARIARLERESVRLRKGRITGINPNDVDIGASGIPYDNIPGLGSFAVGDVVDTLISGNRALVLGAPTSRLIWTGVSFNSGWRNWSSGSHPVQYAKLPNGLVLLRGMATKNARPTNFEVIFRLPARFRPASGVGDRHFATIHDDLFTGISVKSDGDVYIRVVTSTWVNDTSWLAFDGMRFVAEL